MRVVRLHAITYTAINTMLAGIWVLTGATGTFWPAWPIVTWGAALGIHAGVTAALPSAGRRQLGGGDRTERELDLAQDEMSLSDGRRKWVVVMFIDIVGSTALNETLGDEAWHHILTEHRTRIREGLTICGGVEVGTAGDGLMVRFDSPPAAVLCAIDIQAQIDEVNRGAGFAPGVRIGIHAGEAVHADSDLLGRVVNLASRVADEASPGEILVTEQVADELGPDVPVDDRGLRPLKGLDRPRHLLAVRWSADVDQSPPAT